MAKTILKGTVEGCKKERKMEKRSEDNIKEWTGMWFGDSLSAAEIGKVGRYCCNVICGVPITVKIKGLR